MVLLLSLALLVAGTIVPTNAGAITDPYILSTAVLPSGDGVKGLSLTRVIGMVRKSAHIPGLSKSVVSHWPGLYTADLPTAIFVATAGQGVDVGLDVVGGPMFEPCLKSLVLRGRHVAIAFNPDPRVSFDLVDFYHRELRLFGVNSLKITFEQEAEIRRGPGDDDAGDDAHLAVRIALADGVCPGPDFNNAPDKPEHEEDAESRAETLLQLGRGTAAGRLGEDRSRAEDGFARKSNQ